MEALAGYGASFMIHRSRSAFVFRACSSKKMVASIVKIPSHLLCFCFVGDAPELRGTALPQDMLCVIRFSLLLQPPTGQHCIMCALLFRPAPK